MKTLRVIKDVTLAVTAIAFVMGAVLSLLSNFISDGHIKKYGTNN